MEVGGGGGRVGERQLELEALGKASEKWTELKDTKTDPWKALRQREDDPWPHPTW